MHIFINGLEVYVEHIRTRDPFEIDHKSHFFVIAHKGHNRNSVTLADLRRLMHFQ